MSEHQTRSSDSTGNGTKIPQSLHQRIRLVNRSINLKFRAVQWNEEWNEMKWEEKCEIKAMAASSSVEPRDESTTYYLNSSGHISFNIKLVSSLNEYLEINRCQRRECGVESVRDFSIFFDFSLYTSSCKLLSSYFPCSIARESAINKLLYQTKTLKWCQKYPKRNLSRTLLNEEISHRKIIIPTNSRQIILFTFFYWSISSKWSTIYVTRCYERFMGGRWETTNYVVGRWTTGSL